MSVASPSFAQRKKHSFHNAKSQLDGSFEGMDEHTAALILQLQLADLEDVMSSGKGKGREDQASDQDIAISAYRQEVETRLSLLADRRMTESIAKAVQTDGPLVKRSQIEARDHDLALHLQDGQAHPQDHDAQHDNITIDSGGLDDELLTKLEMMYVSDMPPIEAGESFLYEDDYSEELAGPSTSKSTERAVNMRNDHRCIACLESKSFLEVARVPCGHEYCRGCLSGLYEASLTDESLFPPRCCTQKFDMNQLRMFLTSNIVTRFKNKEVEYMTSNRVYCSRSTCSTFIPSRNIDGDHARCSSCKQETCAICKLPWHTGDCPQDTALQALLQTATENGWQRCTSCHRLIELDIGCNHIT